MLVCFIISFELQKLINLFGVDFFCYNPFLFVQQIYCRGLIHIICLSETGKIVFYFSLLHLRGLVQVHPSFQVMFTDLLCPVAFYQWKFTEVCSYCICQHSNYLNALFFPGTAVHTVKLWHLLPAMTAIGVPENDDCIRRFN